MSDTADGAPRVPHTDIQPEDDENQAGGLPAWVLPMPEGMNPPRGVTVFYIKIKAEWTAMPALGDRILVLWTLMARDEQMAYQRAEGRLMSAIGELAKSMVRAFSVQDTDGSRFMLRGSHSGKRSDPNSLDRLWDEIGPKGRSLVQRQYTQTHNLDVGETAYFLGNCVVVATAT